MVIGYLDIFVFEEFVLALRPVVDGGDCVLQADSGIAVRTSWQAQYFGNNWLTACCSIDSVPTPLFFHESWQGSDRAQNGIITYH